MKSKYLPLACAATLLIAGCDSKDNRPGDPEVNTNTPDENLNNPPATNPPSNPAPQTKVQSYPPSANSGGTEVLEIEDMKQDYLANVTERLRDLDAKVDALKQKAERSNNEVKQQADAALADLRQQQKKVATQLEQLRAATEASWQEVRSGFEAALEDLKKSYTNATAKLNHSGS